MKTISAYTSPQAVAPPPTPTHPALPPLQMLSSSTPDLQISFLQAQPVLSTAGFSPKEGTGKGLALSRSWALTRGQRTPEVPGC